jgi:hypothetical protein
MSSSTTTSVQDQDKKHVETTKENIIIKDASKIDLTKSIQDAKSLRLHVDDLVNRLTQGHPCLLKYIQDRLSLEIDDDNIMDNLEDGFKAFISFKNAGDPKSALRSIEPRHRFFESQKTGGWCSRRPVTVTYQKEDYSDELPAAVRRAVSHLKSAKRLFMSRILSEIKKFQFLATFIQETSVQKSVNALLQVPVVLKFVQSILQEMNLGISFNDVEKLGKEVTVETLLPLCAPFLCLWCGSIYKSLYELEKYEKLIDLATSHE